MQLLEQYDDNGDPTGYGQYPQLTTSDVSEWNKLQPYVSRVQGQEQAPWWQSIIQYGAVKALDNTFPGRTNGIQGNTAPGSFAGQNGTTYNQRGSQNAPPSPAAGLGLANASTGMFGLSPLMLIAIGAALFIAFKR